MLRATCCSYVSSFLHFQGSAFQFQCMYASPHPVKKCVVLCVKELLCYVNPSLGPTSPDAPFRNNGNDGLMICRDVGYHPILQLSTIL